MTLAAQDIGFTNPVARGTTIDLVFNVLGILASEVASATWRLADGDPKLPGVNVVVTKTSGAAEITYADDATAGVNFTVKVLPADTANLPEDDYYHELSLVWTNGRDDVASEGTWRLAARLPGLI